MAGTAAGIRKGWRTRREQARKATAATIAERKAQTKALKRLAERAAAASERSRSTVISGLPINLQEIDDEYQPQLASLSGRVSLLQQMGAGDAKIAAQLRANILPMFSAVRKTVVGGTQEQRDLITQNLFREGDPRFWCETSWLQRILEKCMSLQYGFALHHNYWEPVDGYNIIRSKTYLHPKSMGGPIGAWEWDKSGKRLVAIHRKYRRPDGTQETDERIPIYDIDATVWWMTGENWEGQSLIRSMYGAWKRKDLGAKIAMIALMNGGVGIPMATLGPNDAQKDRDTLKTMAGDLRGGDKSRNFLVLANGQKMEFLTTNGQIVDARPVIEGENMEIASAGTTDFMQQGQTASGSRAGGSVMMVSYMQQLDAEVRWIEEQINHGAGYLPGDVERLIYANFQNVKECPRISLSRVSPTEQLDNVPNICTAVQQGAITHEITVENHVRNSLGVPQLTQAQLDKAKASMQPTDLGGRPDSPTPTDRNEPRDDDAGRAFGLSVEKKSPDDGVNRPRKSPASFPWLRLNPA